MEIVPKSPLSCVKFNPRSPEWLAGGSYNGLVGFWDLRKGSQPLHTSLIEQSHKDPVSDLFWIQSRSGSEFVTTSTDGQLLWWDTRKLKSGPTDSMHLTDQKGEMAGVSFGGTCLEYKSDGGATRYLLGTEQGLSVQIDRRSKQDEGTVKVFKQKYGVQQGRHHSRVYAIERNPFNLKYFMTIGDWSSRIWMEELRSPILTTPYDSSYLTSGCWSATRPGVFYTTKMDGTMDVWDYSQKHNAPIYSTKVNEAGLSCIQVERKYGELVGVGGYDGSVSILQLSRDLAKSRNLQEEKKFVSAMLERETSRERQLEKIYNKHKVQAARQDEKKQTKLHIFDPHDDDDEETRKVLDAASDAFWQVIDVNETENKNSSSSSAASSAASLAHAGGASESKGNESHI
jgi:dynein intermediate chain 2